MEFKVGDIVYGKPGIIRKLFLGIRFEIISISASNYTVIALDPCEEITKLREANDNNIDFLISINDDAVYLAEDRNDINWWLENVV